MLNPATALARVLVDELARSGVTEAVIADGWIAGVGAYDWPARQTLALSGRMVLPGLIDAHMHLESTLLTPAELARLIVPHGTTAIISDSHEIGNVLVASPLPCLVSTRRLDCAKPLGIPVAFRPLPRQGHPRQIVRSGLCWRHVRPRRLLGS